MKIDLIKINIENRIRHDFGDIEKLADGIKKYGLLHPIVVKVAAEGDRYDLIAGERRWRAHCFLGYTQIEATILEDADEVVAKEIELEENINRHQLSWPEQVEAIRQLDDIKRKLYGDKAHGDDYGEGWGLEETARQLGQSVGGVSQDIQLAKDLEAMPQLAVKVMNMPKHAARKMIKMQKKAQQLQKRIDSKDLTIQIDLRHGSCTDLVLELPDASVDLWLTDPPFAVDKICEVGKDGYNLTKTNVGDKDVMQDVYDVLIPAMFDKMRNGAHFYMFFGHKWYPKLVTMLRAVGFIVDDTPLIWYKQRVSTMAKDMHYMSSYEPILFGYKPPVTNILKKPVKNVFPISAINPQARVHPLQRPEELLAILIENSTEVGETVLDTFSGSGSTLVAAHRLKRNAIGFEIDNGNYLRALEWFEKEFKDVN